MNAWACDGCGAIRRDRPVGWLNVRELIEMPSPRGLFDTGLTEPRLYCSTDCLAAAFLLRSVEEGAAS